ncbi:MAG TPA: DUF4440 domain-containing protein [Terriglobia bacterium]|nr:DUF4440 domain-containing protein [Terriglobia bacterium]
MKRIFVVFMIFVLAMACTVLVAQQRPGGMARHSHMRTPSATGPMLDIANELVAAINHQDAAALQKMLAPDAVYLDEDGHAPPARAWVHKLTSDAQKHIVISATHSQMWRDAGWVSFNYALTEEYRGQPKTLEGTTSYRLQKNGRQLANSTRSRSPETEGRRLHAVGMW